MSTRLYRIRSYLTEKIKYYSAELPKDKSNNILNNPDFKKNIILEGCIRKPFGIIIQKKTTTNTKIRKYSSLFISSDVGLVCKTNKKRPSRWHRNQSCNQERKVLTPLSPLESGHSTWFFPTSKTVWLDSAATGLLHMCSAGSLEGSTALLCPHLRR